LIPLNTDPVDYFRTIILHNKAQNKYEQKILNVFNDNHKNFDHFDKIIKEYSSLELDNLPMIASIASIKWLKPVHIQQLQSYMKKKLGWIESYTFIKVKSPSKPFHKHYFIFQGFSIINTFSNTLSS
jgi:hypothetical protein